MRYLIKSKRTAIKPSIEVKKSEPLPVVIALLRDFDTSELQELVGMLTSIKTGRPKEVKQLSYLLNRSRQTYTDLPYVRANATAVGRDSSVSPGGFSQGRQTTNWFGNYR
jgi:hypothetical protein